MGDFFMIIVRIKGGIGNQLFQYATAYALSRKLKKILGFNVGFTSNMTARGYRLSEFNIVDNVVLDDKLPGAIKIFKNKYVNKSMRVLHIGNVKCNDWQYVLETKEDYNEHLLTLNSRKIYIDGYFQSYKYFEEYRSDLLKQLTPKQGFNTECLQVLDSIEKCNSVAVHIRRGDFKKSYNKFHYLLDVDYYQRAIDYMESVVENPVFFFFSDDIEWIKDNLGERECFRFINVKTRDIDDLMFMKNCKHIITANSTFSWWGAWLNENDNAIRIVPQKSYGNYQMIPDGWIKM